MTSANGTTPRAIGKYEVICKLGEGGMGTVYKARHPDTGEAVAVKVVKPKENPSPVLLKRFEQEFRAARQLEHPHIVRGLDFGRHGDSLFLVMEYVDGPSLGDRVESEGRLPEEEAVRLVVEVARALHEAHRQGIIHRDVKPDNILVGPDGRAKLTDLGLAKDVNDDADLTRPATGLGTPSFMAPEQFGDAKHADARCDVYSLAATLFVLVTGKLPFSGRGVGMLRKKLADDLTPPLKLVPGLCPRIDLAIRRALRADPGQRFANCEEFVVALTGAAVAPAAPVGKPILSLDRKAPRNERRVTVRYPSRLEGACQAVGAYTEDRLVGAVHDVSCGGIGLMLPRRFEPGTVLTVELPVPSPGRPRRLLARVQRVQKVSKKWLVGCEFARRISEEEVNSLR